ncbi:MAG: class I SAM-dependent methyltransferase [Planctomycetes bacterium]|nr:class I SAM-dependent methyltransferase [Planctomycetota bacterium]
MGYAKFLKTLFQGVTLNVEDLLFLESFEIEHLPDRVPKQEFAVLLGANPIIHRYFVAKYPPISNFIDAILKEETPVKNNKTIDENCSDLLWEIADLIVYNKYPEIYDTNVEFAWDIDEIISVKSLEGKVAIDVGAGPGKLAFKAAQFADTVFAVEPVHSFRQFIKGKASRENVKNLFVVDGFLDSIPFPENSVDVLMTSEAIGWNLEKELKEIDRVLKPNAYAIHLFRNFDADGESEKNIHGLLASSEWKYECTKYQDTMGWKLKYHKTMSC